MSDKFSGKDGSEEKQFSDSNSEIEPESAARAPSEIYEGNVDDVSKEEGNDTEKSTTGSEDSGGEKLYSDFLKENMEYDSKEDTDFEPSQADSNDDSECSGGTEIEEPPSEEDFDPDEMDSDDERLITLKQLQNRSHIVQAKLRLLNQMTDDEILSVQKQIAFLINNSEKKMDAKYKIMNKMFRDLVDMERFMVIAVEIIKSKNEIQTAFQGTPSKKSRRELQYATKHVELAENVDSLLQNVIGLLKQYFEVSE